MAVLPFFIALPSPELVSQSLYHEDFELPSGTIVDNGPTAWTRDITNADLGGGGFFETRIVGALSVFQAVDTDGEAIWLSDVIDISAFSTVVASAEIAENGTLEGNDYIRLYYRLDGDSEIIFGDFRNDFGNTFQTVTSPELSGATLQLIIRVKNNETDEEYLIDNVKVTDGSVNTTTLYSVGSRQWDNQNTWSISGVGGPSCHCTPNSNTDVIIGSDHAVRLNAVANVKSITIQDTGSIFANSAANLVIEGNLINNSSHTDPIGQNVNTLTLNGTNDQDLDINGEQVFDLIVNKASGVVRLQSQLNLLNYLSIQTSTQFISDGNLRVISTSDDVSGNGAIGELPLGASVTGGVTVQRYISGEGNIWRYISSPVSNATIADWQDDFPITGSFEDPSTGPGINSTSPSLYYYAESGSGSNKQLGWIAYPASGNAAGNRILPGAGYAALMLDGSNSTLIDVTGTINQGDFGFNVSIAGSGWNLLGNPYPATVDWKNTNGWSRSNVANAIYIRNNENGNANSTITSFVDGIGTNGGTGLVATGQSFWIYATGNDPALTINERAKSSSTGAFFRKQEPVNFFRVTLMSDTQSDEAVIRFSDSATIGYDPEKDALKFPNGGINVATFITPEQPMAINALPLVQDFSNTYLELDNTSPGNYIFRFTEMFKLDPAYSVTLIDHYRNESLLVADSTELAFSVTKETGSFSNRFELVIEHNVVTNVPSLLEPGVMIHPNPVYRYLNISFSDTNQGSWLIKVFNSQGQLVSDLQFTGTKDMIPLDFSNYPAGLYSVQVVGVHQKRNFRVINAP